MRKVCRANDPECWENTIPMINQTFSTEHKKENGVGGRKIAGPGFFKPVDKAPQKPGPAPVPVSVRNEPQNVQEELKQRQQMEQDKRDTDKKRKDDDIKRQQEQREAIRKEQRKEQRKEEQLEEDLDLPVPPKRTVPEEANKEIDEAKVEGDLNQIIEQKQKERIETQHQGQYMGQDAKWHDASNIPRFGEFVGQAVQHTLSSVIPVSLSPDANDYGYDQLYHGHEVAPQEEGEKQSDLGGSEMDDFYGAQKSTYHDGGASEEPSHGGVW